MRDTIGSNPVILPKLPRRTPANDKSEAIAEACAHLNNHALPNVYALVKQLKDLAEYVSIIERSVGGDWSNDPRVARAKQSVRDFTPHIVTNL